MNFKRKQKLATAAVVALAALTLSEPAFAQSAEGWEQPAVKIIELLGSGLVKIGIPLIGIGIIGFGLWGALTARIQWDKFGYILIGGLLVMAGPTMVKALLAAVN